LYFPIFHEDKVQGMAVHYTWNRSREQKTPEKVGKENGRESGKRKWGKKIGRESGKRK
jgi:hypothetical protein